MKNSLIYSVLSIVMMILVTSCTTNDGDIGFLGGHWRLDAIEIDGTNDDDYSGNITWAFQNRIIEISVLGPNHSRANFFGTFTHQDNTLVIDYTHSSDDIPPGNGEYRLPVELHLTAPVIVTFQIAENTRRSMTLITTNDNGQNLKFSLSKIY